MAETVEALKIRLSSFCDSVVADKGIVANNEVVAVVLRQVMARIKTLLDVVI